MKIHQAKKTPCLKVYFPDHNPSTTTPNDINSNYIEAFDKNYDWTFCNMEDKGKWMIRFKKGDLRIDDAWKATLKGIGEGKFIEAKVSLCNEEYDDQIIFIYNADAKNVEEIVKTYNEIKSRKITEGALDQIIKYKTDKATLQGSDENLYTASDIPQLQKRRLRELQKRRLRVHPAFPTLAETSIDPDIIFSDHAAIFSEVKTNKSKLRLLSYNVLGATTKNNLTRQDENDEIAKQRYQRIADGLKLSADKLKVDVITLQEVSSFIMVKLLKDTLREEWRIIPDAEEAIRDNASQLTCYRKSSLTLCQDKSIDSDEPGDASGDRKIVGSYCKDSVLLDSKRALSSTFIFNKTNEKIHIHNVWGHYDIFPKSLEEQFKKLLLNKEPGEIVILIGDTNSRMAPLDDERRNIITGIFPSWCNLDYLLPEEIQGGDHPDGGFYSKDDKIHQLTHVTVDLTKGTAFKETDMRTSYNTEEEEKIWRCLRAVLCLDSVYEEKQIIDNKTIFDYEKKLKRELKDNTLLVRVAATLMNEKGVMIKFKIGSQFLEKLKKSCGNDPDFEFKRLTSPQGARYPCLFVFNENIPKLSKKINAIISKGKSIFSAIKIKTQSNSQEILKARERTLENEIKKIFNLKDITHLEYAAGEAIDKASDDYLYLSKKIGFGCTRGALNLVLSGLKIFGTFGLYGVYRGDEYELRMDQAGFKKNRRSTNLYPTVETLIKLLDDESRGGKDLLSLKYFLASYISKQTAKTDSEAKFIIDKVREQLKAKRKQLQPIKDQVGNTKEFRIGKTDGFKVENIEELKKEDEEKLNLI